MKNRKVPPDVITMADGISTIEAEDGSNALMLLPSKHSKRDREINKARKKEVKKQTNKEKSMHRKLRKMQEEAENKKMRAEVLETLNKHKLADNVFPLLHSSGTLGQAETLKSKLRRGIRLKRAGLVVPEDIPLFHKRKYVHDFLSAGKEGAERTTTNESPVFSAVALGSDNHADSQAVHLAPKSFVEPVIKKRRGKKKMHITDLHEYFQKVDRSFESVHLYSMDETNKASLQLKKKLKDGSEFQSFPELSSVVNNAQCAKTKKKLQKSKIVLAHNPSAEQMTCLENQPRDSSNKEAGASLSPASGSETLEHKQSPHVVYVLRTEEIAKARESLPIVMMEQEIMEAINNNPVIIVCGETGCGKTTQVPQFLFEAGYGSSRFQAKSGMIGVTQPRRVAVLATARRVAQELNVNLGQEVGFQVRHDCSVGKSCIIKFMTDGILVREIQTDFLLRKYSVIVLDEAHERSLNTDILIGMLSRIILLRQKMLIPLKLVIMSATLRVEDFTANHQLFRIPPPVLQVQARQFPVSIHFSKKTELQDYVGAAYKKVCAIHAKLPPGGILVFLTGQKEVEDLCRKLRVAFPPGKKRVSLQHKEAYRFCDKVHEKSTSIVEKQTEPEFGGLNMEIITAAVDRKGEPNGFKHFMQEEEEPDEGIPWNMSDSEQESGVQSDDELLSDEEPNKTGDTLSIIWKSMQSIPCSANGKWGEDLHHAQGSGLDSMDSRADSKALYVLPLYAMLPASAQLLVFGNVPDGARLLVVATNVAETSITIPGIRYVIDCGRVKERDYDRGTGMSKYEVRWISKASADQRAGRAGRLGPGHCYRLYSSAHFNDSFPEFLLPEMNKAPIEGVVLLMKCMGIDKVVNFPFPTPPDFTAVIEAERCLTCLSALMPDTGMLTPMGQAMSVYPVSPRHSRMLLAVLQSAQEVLRENSSDVSLTIAYAISVAAALSLEDPFLRETFYDKEEGDGDSAWKTNSVVTQETFVKKSLRATEPGARENSAAVEMASRKAARLAAHKKFYNVHSDSISVANALWAYEKSSDQDQFCREHFLHAKTMLEMSKLRKQLLDLIFRQSGEALANIDRSVNSKLIWDRIWVANSEDLWQEPCQTKLNLKQEIVIRQAICAGWADRVSRRLSISESTRITEVGGRQRTRDKYQACLLEEPVFLHPSSRVCKGRPDFVVYSELVHTSRPYMRGVTVVDPHWFTSQASALCSFSKPLEEPSPWYNYLSDEVMCWVTPTFGPHVWELPLQSVVLKKGKLRTAVFACSLLQGKVLPSIGSLSDYLTNSPFILIRPESQALKRVSDLLHRLGNVDTRKKLAEAWAADTKFLYPEILSWLQHTHRSKLDDIWERARQEASRTLSVADP